MSNRQQKTRKETETEGSPNSQEQLLETMRQLMQNHQELLERQDERIEQIREERKEEQRQAAKEREEQQSMLKQEWEMKMNHLQLQTLQLQKAEEKEKEMQLRAEEKEQEMKEFMMRQEEARRKHEKELWDKQLEVERLRNEEIKRNRRADKMEPWRDTDQPEAYFVKFERVMAEAKIPKHEWASRLVPLLTGKALSAYSSHVPPAAASDYQSLKEAMLEAMGLSRNHCRRAFWTYQKKHSDTPQDICQQLEFYLNRLMQDCGTVADCKREFLMGKLLSYYPPEVAEFVLLRQPKTALEAANLVQDYQDGRNSWRDRGQLYRKPWHSKAHDYGNSAGGLREEGSRRDSVAKREPDTYGEHRHGSKQSGWKVQRDDSKGSSNEVNDRTPTCFLCGKKGHKRPDCPNRVGRVITPTRKESLKVDGRIGGHDCSMTIDTGAQQTVVHASLVEDHEYTGETIRLMGYNGHTTENPMASVWVHVGEYSIRHEVAVCKEAPSDVLIGLDIGILDYLLTLEKQQRKARAAVNATTRAQHRRNEQEKAQNQFLSEQDKAEPRPLDEVSELEENSDTEDSIVAEQPVEEAEVSLTELGANSEGEENWPVPSLSIDDSDRKTLISQQAADESLKALRQWAQDGEKGYSFQDGVLIHTLDSKHGELWKRVVIPACRRKEILRLSHSSLTGGHFSHNRTEAMLRRVFTWPGVSRDVKQWCRACVECQKSARSTNLKAPLQPLPIITTPFSRVAVDLVGPLPRSKQGHKYLLTCMCLGSKYPDAVPLKRVDAESVAEALVEIFSRIGIPQELLTDQGSVFTGKLTKELCKLLNIHHLKTSPYHPQTDGCLERWHSTLKSMLRKCPETDRQGEWDRLLKYMLFAYRASPHSNTGFSPFEMLYGRPLRGPLDVLQESWLSGDIPQSNAVEWVDQLRERLSVMAEAVRRKEGVAKEKMKKQYDKQAVCREFSVGTLVLVRTPDLHGKLSDLWDGPYEVTRKVSPVTYELAVPHRRSKSMIAHVNRLKRWNNLEASVMRVVIAEDEVGTDDPPGRIALSTPDLTQEQSDQLKALLEEFKDVVCPEVGKVEGVEHTIDTGDHSPIRSAPYRLAPAWRNELREEVRSLLESGVIKPSFSPWSSPMVPVRKPDGSVRLCIDYRRINAVTTPDPYTIPLVEDLLDQLGEAKYLSKLDMNKGFYQIPVAAADRPKTAFCTPWGKYEFQRMPFGLRNAPSSFQRCMHKVMEGCEDMADSYIDDLVVFSRTWEEHLQHLRQVLERLRRHGLTAKPSKCEWGAGSLTYLGHSVGHGRVSVPEARVAAIRDFKRPVTKTDLRAFLGTTGYYRKFIPAYSAHAFPLTEATKKTAPRNIVWNDDLCDAFVYLCNALCDSSMLFIPNSSDDFVLQTDASGHGIGAVLSVMRDGEELPVGYFSKKLSPAERKYAATELECLAVVRAVEHFAVHLLGRPFTIVTDHRALQYLDSSRHLNGRLTRWALQLQQHHFTVRYRPGRNHQNADGLSRQAWSSDDQAQ